MATEKIICAFCGNAAVKQKSELDRQRKKGRDYFFCSLSCSAQFGASLVRAKDIHKICPVCKKQFSTKATCKAATFCSRSCASKGSVTPFRRNKAKESARKNFRHGIKYTAKNMRSREQWKYAALSRQLTGLNLEHVFEYPFEELRYICDLAFPEHKVVVEFDGKNHAFVAQAQADLIRDAAIATLGWTVLRVPVPDNAAIPVDGVLPQILSCLGVT